MPHLYSPLGDTRHNAVPCQHCRTRTWNICARCDTHCTCNECDKPTVPPTPWWR